MASNLTYSVQFRKGGSNSSKRVKGKKAGVEHDLARLNVLPKRLKRDLRVRTC